LHKDWCEMKTMLFCLCLVFLAACDSASATATATAAPLPTGLPSPTQVPSLPSPTPTQILSPTPAGLKYCIVPNLLNLRSGPGIDYSIVVIEGQDTCGQATARNADSSWVYINFGKYTGWAYAKYLSGEGDISTLPLSTTLTQTPPAASQTPAASATITP
jgi:uncharacterized protein YgiM (DUF1202 family)